MSNGNNTRNSLFSDLDNTDLLYINILNTIYNNKIRIINQLLQQNSELTNNLLSFLSSRRRETFTNMFNNNFNQRSNMHNSNTNTNTNTTNNINNSGPDDRRIFIDNIPYYIVDEVQFFTIPTTETNTNPNTNGDNTGNTNLNERHHRRRSTTHRNGLRRHYDNNPNITNEVLPTSIESRGRGFLNSFLQPITIRPTQQQVENATSSLVYGEIVDPINTSCPISLETFTETSQITMIKHCKHIFNRQNLMSWFNTNCKCPVCRYDIRDYNNTEQNEIADENSNVDPNINPQEHMRNIRNITDETVNILENLFHDALYDLSYNNLQFSFR